MRDLMIVETRDPIAHSDVDWTGRLAVAMHAEGVAAAVFLADNGVLGARRGPPSAVADWIRAGVSVAADRFALRERGITDAELLPGVAPADLDVVLERLIGGASVVWR
jgi:hypothetical protein